MSSEGQALVRCEMLRKALERAPEVPDAMTLGDVENWFVRYEAWRASIAPLQVCVTLDEQEN